MKISNIKIQRIKGENTKLKGVVTITFENFIVIRDIKIIAAPDFVFVAMPAIKLLTGEFKDICHPVTMEFRNYIEKSIIDVFNSGESEKTFEGDFAEPKVDIRIKQVSGNDVVIGECDAVFDDKFAVHNIRILKVRDRGMTVVFPYRKTQTDSMVNICELIKNNEKYCNQIVDAYLKMVEDNSNALSNNAEQGNDSNKDEKINTQGWDAITAEAERIYPTQKNPKHYGTLVKYKFGGKDPIDGISVYDGGNYWHFVTYGISELYEKETNNKEISGYGMEFTFKLKKDNYKNEEAEIKNICGILQEFARMTFSNGELFNEYEYLYSGQLDGIDVNKKSNITGFITILDKDFKTIDTPNGKVKFVEFIGVTDDELKAIMSKKLKARELYEMLGSDVTDYYRKSVFENTGDKLDINKPIENPDLKWLIDKYSNSQGDRKNEVIEILLKKIAEESKLLSVAIFSQEPTPKDNGTSTIEAGTKIGFPKVTYQDGKYTYFPAYTDWTELGKNSNLDKEPKTMVFGFDDYAAFILDKSNDDGLVINPYSEHPFFLSRKQIEHIRNVKKNNANVGSANKLKAYLFEAQGYPKFVFYFPENLGEIEKPYSNVFEIKKDKLQKVRVMISKCASVSNLEADTKEWIEKNKIDSKMEEVAYRKEMIKNIPIEVYELKYSEHPDWAHKIYKIGFVNGCRITISGWLVKGREEIINQAFEKIELKESRDDLANGEVSLGILGKYSLKDVGCDSDFDSDEEYFEFVKKILKLYNDNIELTNRRLLFRMYDALSSCRFPLWKENGFKKIIDEDKLPENFQNMTDEEKSKLFYGFEINEDNIKEALSNNVPFINIDKLKYDIVVQNVNISKKFNEISIEFDGICNFFYAMVTFKYDDNFKISDFHVS